MYHEEEFEIEPRKQDILLSLLVTLRLVLLNFEWFCIKKYCSNRSVFESFHCWAITEDEVGGKSV